MGPCVSEPTLRHFIYMLRWMDGDDKETRQEREQAFHDELNAAQACIYALAGKGEPPVVPFPESQDRLVGKRIRKIGWLTGCSPDFSLEARTHGDVFTLHMTYYYQGEQAPTVFQEMQAMAWHPRVGENLVGESWYAQGIVSQEQMEAVAKDVLNILRSCPKTTSVFEPPSPGEKPEVVSGQVLSGGSGDSLVWAPLSWGRLYRCDGAPHCAFLVYPSSEEEVPASIFLDQVAVQLELYTYLSEVQFQNYEQDLRPHIEARELKLRGIVEDIRRVDDDLKSVQEKLVRLAGLTREYAESVGKVKGYLQSITVNRQNLKDVLSRAFPKGDGDVFLTPLEQAKCQIESDLIYQEVEQSKALVALQTLQTQVEIRRAEIDSQTNFWLSLIAIVVAVGQLVGEDMANWLSRWLPFQMGVTLIRVALVALAVEGLVAWRWRSHGRRNQNKP